MNPIEHRTFSEVPDSFFEGEVLPDQPILLRKEMFPEGSIGYTYFPEDLEGKFRPAGVLLQPIEAIRSKEAKTPATFRERPIGNILSAPLLLTRNLSYNSCIDILKKHLDNLTVAPEARFIGDIVNQAQRPLPRGYEEELQVVVREQVATLDPMQQTVLRLHYGFDDGIARPYDVIVNSSIPNPKAIDAQAKEYLRSGMKAYILQGYSTIPKNSLAYAAFGAHIRNDVPFMYGRLSDLPLSQNATEEVGSKIRYRIKDAALLSISFSPSTHDELVQALQGKAAEVPQFSDPILIPQFSFTQEELLTLHQLPIDILGLRVRVRNGISRSDKTTIGDLLTTTPEEIATFKPFGSVAAAELISTLLDYFSIGDHAQQEAIRKEFMRRFHEGELVIEAQKRIQRDKRKKTETPLVEKSQEEIMVSEGKIDKDSALSEERTEIKAETVIYEASPNILERMKRRLRQAKEKIKKHLDLPSET